MKIDLDQINNIDDLRVTIEQDLSSNSTTSVPSVSAVKNAINTGQIYTSTLVELIHPAITNGVQTITLPANSVVEDVFRDELVGTKNGNNQYYVSPIKSYTIATNTLTILATVNIRIGDIVRVKYRVFSATGSATPPATPTDGVTGGGSGSGNETSSKSFFRATSNEIRAINDITGIGSIYTVENGKRGLWYIDTTDKVSSDNTGTVLVTASNARVKRDYNGPIYTSWFGLVANDRNEAANNAGKLNDLIESINNEHIILNRDANGNKNYYFGAVANSGAFDRTKELCSINFRDKYMTFEGETGVTIQTEPGLVGIQTYRTIGDSFLKLKNIKLNAIGGADESYGKLENGGFNNNWGSYKVNGINMWGSGHWEDVDVYGYPGNGACIFGTTGIKLNGAAFTISGQIQRYNQYDKLIFDDPSIIINKFTYRTILVINNIPYSIEGNYGGDVGITFRVTDADSLPVGTRVDAYAYPRGNTLFADHIKSTGSNNFDGNGACGIFTTSDEANQGEFKGISVRNNGGWGIADTSLLGNTWYTPHGTQNGQRFNVLYAPDDQRQLNMGSFSNENGGQIYNTTASRFIGFYTEQGNQGMNKFGASTGYVIQFDGAGSTGGFRIG